jgi:hypothetical protein
MARTVVHNKYLVWKYDGLAFMFIKDNVTGKIYTQALPIRISLRVLHVLKSHPCLAFHTSLLP